MANVLNIFSPWFIRTIEDTMDWYDHIAFSFLLVKRGDESTALDWIQQLVKLRGEENPNWKRVAVRLAIKSAEMDSYAVTEALFQLKQWKLLGLIGYPDASTVKIYTGHLCPFRVGLFNILDQLDYNNAHSLVLSLSGENNNHQIIEVAVLEWILRGIISSNDCTKLTLALAQLSRNDLAALSSRLQNRPETLNELKDQTILESVSTTGYCLIICQKNIYIEPDPMLRHVCTIRIVQFTIY